MGVDDGAFAVGSLIELPHSVLTEEREIVEHFVQVFASPDLFPLPEIRPARHNKSILALSLFVRYEIERVLFYEILYDASGG